MEEATVSHVLPCKWVGFCGAPRQVIPSSVGDACQDSLALEDKWELAYRHWSTVLETIRVGAELVTIFPVEVVAATGSALRGTVTLAKVASTLAACARVGTAQVGGGF